jgi:hypothetical protein
VTGDADAKLGPLLDTESGSLSIPPLPASLDAESSVFRDFNAEFSGAGEVDLIAEIQAEELDGSPIAAEIKQRFEVLAKPLSVTITPDPSPLVYNQNTTQNEVSFLVNIKNNTDRTIRKVAIAGGQDGLTITSRDPENPGVPLTPVSFTPPANATIPPGEPPEVTLEANESADFIFVYEAIDGPAKLDIEALVTADDNGETITTLGTEELAIVDNILVRWGFNIDRTEALSGQVVRLDGFLRNETGTSANPEDSVEEKTILVTLFSQTEGNLGGAFPFVLGENPGAFVNFVLGPGESKELRSLPKSVQADVATDGTVKFGVRIWVLEEDGSTTNADDQAKLWESGEVDGGFLGEEFTIRFLPNPLPPQEAFLDCGYAAWFCGGVSGAENLYDGIVGIGGFLGTTLLDFGNYELKLLAWTADMLGKGARAVLGDDEAFREIRDEIALDIRALWDAGVITAEQAGGVIGGTPDLAAAIGESMIQTLDRTVEAVSTGDLEAIQYHLAQFAIENIDLTFEALVATKTLAKLATRIPKTNSTVGRSLARQEARQAEELGERIARARREGRPVETAFAAGDEISLALLRDVYGVTPDQVKYLQDIAADKNVVITFRSRNPASIALLESSQAWPKPMGLKYKTVNRIDIDYLGYRPDAFAKVEVVEPPLGFRDFAVDGKNKIVDEGAFQSQLDEYMDGILRDRPDDLDLADPVLFAEVRGRLEARVREWYKLGPGLDEAVEKGLPTNFGLNAQFPGGRLPNGRAFDLGANEVRKVEKNLVSGPDSTRRYFEIKMSDPSGSDFRQVTGDVDFIAILNPDGTFPLDNQKRLEIYEALRPLLDMQHGESFSFFKQNAREEYLRCCTEGGEAMVAIGPGGTPRAAFFADNLSVVEGGRNSDLRLSIPDGDFILLRGKEYHIKTRLGILGRLVPRTFEEAIEGFISRFRSRLIFWLPRLVHQQLSGSGEGDAEFSRDSETPIVQLNDDTTLQAGRSVTPFEFRVWTPGNGWQLMSRAEALRMGDPARADMAPMAVLPEGASAGDRRVAISSLESLGATGAFFQPGDLVVLNPGYPSQDYALVEALGSLIFTQPLCGDHNPGEMIALVTSEVPVEDLAASSICGCGTLTADDDMNGIPDCTEALNLQASDRIFSDKFRSRAVDLQ